MSHTPHELAEEFPDDANTIHQLKLGNSHFSKLMDDYHAVNKEVHRIEAEIEPASDFALEELKKKRLLLKDQIARMIEDT